MHLRPGLIVHSHVCFRLVKMVVKATEVNPRAAGKSDYSEMQQTTATGSKYARIQMETLSKAEEKSILVAKELKFVKSLAGNDAKLRRKVMKNLKIWLATRSRSTFAFTDTDFLRLWKGLFYCMWMSDKPLVQESLADEIASLVKCFEDISVALQYFGTFLETMCIEWFGIDHWRMDKFMMLVRRCTRQMLIVLHEAEWPKDHVSELMKHIERTILNPDKSPFGLTKHFDDLLLEEIAKVSEGEIEPEIVHIIVNTYAIRLISTNDMRLMKHITSSIFHPLLYQSELGQDYQEKFELWKKTNFVTGNIDDVDFDIQYEQDDDAEGEQDDQEEEEDESGAHTGEKVYDPRAGQVDVEIHEIRFDPLKIVEMFESNRFKPFVTSKGKKQMKMLMRQYKKFSEGIFPLGIQSMESIAKKDYAVDIDEQVAELEHYQEEVVGEKIPKKKKRKELAKLKQQQTTEKGPKIDESNVWTETDENPENSDPKPATKSDSKKKTRKKVSKAQIKEEKLKKLKTKREAKLAAIKQQKQESKVVKKSSKVVAEPKQDSPKKVEAVTPSAPKAEPQKTKSKAAFAVHDEWSEPLKEGETEFFIPSRKTKLKEANKQLSEESASPSPNKLKQSLVKNPFATPKNSSKLKRSMATPQTDGPSEKKRVKIALNKNIFQDLHQHIQQVKSSPKVPYDSSKKPSKGALKPNLMPSPINPFYRKKIGLKLNDTL